MDYRRLERIRKDPVEVQVTARKILRNLDGSLSDWEKDFLRPLERFKGPEPLSIRQAETLIRLDDRASRTAVCAGFRATALIHQLWLARFDLDEDDESFVCRKHEEGPTLTLSRNEWRYVFTLCRQLHITEEYIDVA